MKKIYVFSIINMPFVSLPIWYNAKYARLTFGINPIRDMAELGWDARVALSVYGAFNSREYLNAQMIR